MSPPALSHGVLGCAVRGARASSALLLLLQRRRHHHHHYHTHTLPQPQMHPQQTMASPLPFSRQAPFTTSCLFVPPTARTRTSLLPTSHMLTLRSLATSATTHSTHPTPYTTATTTTDIASSAASPAPNPTVSSVGGSGSGSGPLSGGEGADVVVAHMPLRSVDIETPEEILHGIAHLGELRELGLGSYATPVGLLQNLIELCSASTGLPWAVGIVLTTCALRLAVFPLVVQSMRNNVRLMNIQPEVQVHTERMRACTNAGDKDGANQAIERLQQLFATNHCHPLRSLVPALVQMPVFISFFLAIRKMAELPVESLKHGGYLWFTDLTVADPTYALPAIATLTMVATLELGSEGLKQTKPAMKMLFRVLPFVLLPVTVGFPAGMFMYWITANTFSLSQLIVLRVPALRSLLKIPTPNTVAPAAESNQSFVESTKTAYQAYMDKQAALQKEREEQMRQDALRKMKIPKKPSA